MSERKSAAPTRSLTQHERARLWQSVIAARAKGDPWRVVAERTGLCERQCRRIYRAHMRSTPTMPGMDAVREIEEAIAFYDQAISELAILSMTTTSDTARVAAIRARINARTRKLELMSVAGVLDNARREVDVRAIANAVIAAFNDNNVPDDARRAVLAALRGEASSAGGPI